MVWVGDSYLMGVHHMLETMLSWLDEEAIFRGREGWNFLDWVPGWPLGIPPGADGGRKATQNWMLVWTLQKTAEMNLSLGEPEMAARWQRCADELALTTFSGKRVILKTFCLLQ